MYEMKAKSLSILAIGIIAIIGLVTATAIIPHSNNNLVFAKKPDDKGGDKKTKTDVKVQVKVKGIPVDTGAISTTLSINGGNPQIRTQTLDDNETSIVVNFNKVTAAKGDPFTVTVNSRTVDGQITETKKPNKVLINLS